MTIIPSGWRLLVMAALLSLAAIARAGDERPALAPTPVWTLAPATADAKTAAAAQAAEGVRYLVVDDQIALHLPQPAEYRRLVYEVATPAGRAEAGQFEISFRPEYQTVALHAIGIMRDGVRRDLMSAARYELLRRESSLDEGILDGARSWHVTLPDIRVGDRIEYAYTVTGLNPVFDGHYYGDFAAAFGVDLPLRRLAVVQPADNRLQSRVTHPGFRREVELIGGLERIVWTGVGLQGVDADDDAPSWVDPYGRIELSEARDWQEVARWAAAIYPARFADRAVAGTMTARLGLGRGDPRGRAMRALAFVQNQIRYTGIEIGSGSHAPSTAEVTLARRFGDCKDKAVLLVALLAEAGIQAQPVLVDTEALGRVRDHIPSAVAFDHVVVRMRLDGRWRYVDPTRDHQAGPLEQREPLPYEAGLPVTADADALVDIPQPRAERPVVEVEQSLVLGFDAETARGSADVTVATVYRRKAAVRIRYRFASDGAEAIGESYLDYMRGYYDEIYQVEPLVLDRGAADGSVRVTERYRLHWNEPSVDDVLDLVLFQLVDWVPRRTEDVRTLPLALDGPEWGRQTIRVVWPNGWTIEPEMQRIGNPHFSLERRVAADGGTLTVEGEWRRTSASVPPADFPEARRQLREARDLLSYPIKLGPTPPAAPDLAARRWGLAGLVLVALVLAVAWRRRAATPFAGVFYRPRRTSSALHGSESGMAVPVAVIGVVSLLTALLDIDTARLLEGEVGAYGLWAGSMLSSVGVTVVSIGATSVGFRVLGRPVGVVALLRAAGWASLPMLAFLVGALVAVGGDTELFANEAAAPRLSWFQYGMAAVLLVSGVVWTFFATVSAYAGAAGTSARRAFAATLMLPLALLALGLIVVLIANVAG